MGVVIGIDEAGFGPLLGPLAVTAAVFRVPDADLDACLWRRLHASCSPTPARSDPRLAVADSKQLHRGADDLSLLERAALVMLAAAGHRPATWRELLGILAPDAIEPLLDYPWYSSAEVALPLSRATGDIGTRANPVRRDLDGQGLSFVGAFSEVLWEGHYNRLVRATRNKSTVLISRMLRALRRGLRAADERRARIVVDRLGGRMHYREALGIEFHGFDLRILEETEARSAYRLSGPRDVIDIEFLIEGEKKHLPIALASVYSKYLRELSMLVFNRYWSALAADLRPTAGYYTDAQRWLKDAAPLIDRLSIRRDMLVRER